MSERIDHPAHYGGDTTYEAIKVIEAWSLGFCLGNAVKYICRAGRKPKLVDVTTASDKETVFIEYASDKRSTIEDLKKARWYVDREIQRLEQQ